MPMRGIGRVYTKHRNKSSVKSGYFDCFYLKITKTTLFYKLFDIISYPQVFLFQHKYHSCEWYLCAANPKIKESP
jgi:hypothetical protein